MSRGTKIAWAQDTWNPIVGCSKISPGCAHCYAVGMAGRCAGSAKRFAKHEHRCRAYVGLTRNGNWTGEVRFNGAVLKDPLGWGKPRRVFVCSMGDLFHESVPDQWIDRVFAVMALCPQHTFMVLSKRAERMRGYLIDEDPCTGVDCREGIYQAIRCIEPGQEQSFEKSRWPLPNVWLGVSVEDQKRADERMPVLLHTPAAIRFISCEPLLELVELGLVPDAGMLDWVIVGCESGPGRRDCRIEWVEHIVQTGSRAGVRVFVKQIMLGAAGRNRVGRVSHDVTEWPEELRVRAYPL